ncbi:hypothetical protein I7I48_01256 [Histoplasma ohiense]|nr:hypothetical protein I7I48_01256 [Histoplasma ohiense (nom. inval.)]
MKQSGRQRKLQNTIQTMGSLFIHYSLSKCKFARRFKYIASELVSERGDSKMGEQAKFLGKTDW